MVVGLSASSEPTILLAFPPFLLHSSRSTSTSPVPRRLAGAPLHCRLVARCKIGLPQRNARLVMAARRYHGAAWLLTAAVSLFGAVWPCAAAGPKRVLILSEGPILPYGLVLQDNLVAGLRHDNPEPLNIYEESLDRTQFDSAEYDQQLVALYKAKYLDQVPDLVITITEPALDFALRHRAELFPHSALLFGAVDQRVIRTRDLGTNVTGVFSHYDARATVQAGLKLHPG